MLLVLRGSGGLPSVDAFTRALRFGLRMSFKKSVDEIVRYDVLESRPTNIKQFKGVTDAFRRLSAVVVEVEAKINDGDQVIGEFDKATTATNSSITWTGLASDTVLALANGAAEQAVLNRRKKEEHLLAKDAVLEQARNGAASWTEKIGNLRGLRDAHASHQDYGMLTREIDTAKRSHVGHLTELSTLLNSVRGLIRRAAQSGHLPSFAAELRMADVEVSPLLESAFPSACALSSDLVRALNLLAKCAEYLFPSIVSYTTMWLTLADELLHLGMIRETSAHLFKANKRIEKLGVSIDILLSDDIDAEARPFGDVCNEITCSASSIQCVWQATWSSCAIESSRAWTNPISACRRRLSSASAVLSVT